MDEAWFLSSADSKANRQGIQNGGGLVLSGELVHDMEVADILVFNKGGRGIRLELLKQGKEAPREFLYGFDHIEASGFNARMMSSSERSASVAGHIIELLERAIVRIAAAGVRPISTWAKLREWAPAKLVISFTDGFSLSMGLSRIAGQSPSILIGGFHGLSDIEHRAPAWLRPVNRAVIRASLLRLDHAFFFGDADRVATIKKYRLDAAKTSVIPFGVDTAFWRPLDGEKPEDYFFAVGQDPSRDYDLLVNAPGAHPIWIITSRKLQIPDSASHIRISAGDFYSSGALSDEGLRSAYNRARAVIVPLKDVNQPSGYSVALQAMSCGKPVVISRNKGLWTDSLLVDGQNCLLVPPGDAGAMGEAIGRLRRDDDLCKRIGVAARQTAVTHFGLDKIQHGAVQIAKLGMELWEKRGQLS